ncbi:retroviral-like aspartic protease family protein [Sphingomonas sp. NPDC019816]|uniref:retroviral-like aspartic protease family protein n=1 Tax=Sphingomonas sp. NPDC019816 TaxID=3390679 RepID=UPI003CFBE0DD
MLILAAMAMIQAQPAPPPAPARVVTSTRPAPAASGEAPLQHDTRGRPVMTVQINGKGPFPMVVDTAAQTSLMSRALATELALKPLNGGIGVNGATGSEQARLYPVDRMTNPLIDMRFVAMVELTNAGVTDARGIIGMETFTSRKLLIDRSTKRIAAEPSAAAGPGFATIAGSGTGEGFVQIPLTLDGVRVPALIDTGAAVTIANAAAFRLLGWAENDPRLADGGEIRGASAGGQKIRVARIAKLSIGKIGLSNVPIMISEDDDPTPSIILGNDLLNLFPGYAVDFPRHELQIKLP